MMPVRPRAVIRPQMQKPDAGTVFAFGLRAGYWPCLRAPFVRVDIAWWIVEFWIGGPSYKP